jgi:hypothetical protein
VGRAFTWGAALIRWSAAGGGASYSKAKMRFQSFFMLTTVQPDLIASS